MLARLQNSFLCVDPDARVAALVILMAALIHLALLTALQRKACRLVLLGYPALILLALWLGSYSLSPLRFGEGRLALLRGFKLQQPQRPEQLISSYQTVSAAPGSIIEIEPRLLPGPVDCAWSSSADSVFDDAASCDTAYVVSAVAPYDILRLSVRSACGLPAALGEIKISIMP